jgi:hypothetical protein
MMKHSLAVGAAVKTKAVRAVVSAALALPALLALLVLFAQCASQAGLPHVVTIASGKRTRVLLTQIDSRQTLALQNESSGSQKQIYSDSAGDLAEKVVADDELQRLVDLLAQQGMFQKAGAGAAPGAKELLVVEQDGKRWIWSRLNAAQTTADELMAFSRARTYVMAVYNSAVAYHTRKLTGKDLEAERERVLQSSKAALQKAENQGPPK